MGAVHPSPVYWRNRRTYWNGGYEHSVRIDRAEERGR
jgi:hypothetical protein